jgi:hypothetical protein
VIFTLLAGCAADNAPTRLPDDPASATAQARPPRIMAREQFKGRMWDLTVDSPAVGRQVKVRLLLPIRFETAKTRRWPVLYLLHGCCDTYEAWTRSTDIVSAGNGQPGPLDRDQITSDEIEISIGQENVALVEELRKLGLDAQVELYGAGTHNWLYWQRELDHAWPLITQGLGL